MSDSLEYFPGQIFRDKTGRLDILTQYSSIAVSTTAGFITGAGGQIIRIVSIVAHTTGASNNPTSLTALAANILGINAPPGTTGGELILPFNPAGWVDSPVGASIDISTGAGSPLIITARYIRYTP